MTCNIKEDKRAAYAESVVMEALGDIEPGKKASMTVATNLGSGGLNHTATKRATYKSAIVAVLKRNGNDCRLGTLKTTDFKDDKLKKIADVVDLVKGDLV